MLTYMTIYEPGKEPESRQVASDFPDEPNYAQLRALLEPIINTKHIEHVSVLHENERRDMFVDEYFIERGLPLNDRATNIYRAASLSHDPSTDPDTLPSIQGTAVVFNRRVWF